MMADLHKLQAMSRMPVTRTAVLPRCPFSTGLLKGTLHHTQANISDREFATPQTSFAS